MKLIIKMIKKNVNKKNIIIIKISIFRLKYYEHFKIIEKENNIKSNKKCVYTQKDINELPLEDNVNFSFNKFLSLYSNG